MKLRPGVLANSILGKVKTPRNVRALLKYIAFLLFVIALYTLLFHLIMWGIEGQRHSWIAGLYWAIVTMTTLGYGDIVFVTGVGQLFSVFVLVSGIILFLVVLPYIFVRDFYAPWLESRIWKRVPRTLPKETSGHVILAVWDNIAPRLAARLALHGIRCYVIEPDPRKAVEMTDDGLPVVVGEVDSRQTYENMRAEHARLVVANSEDTVNTNITLTVQEAAPQTPVASLAAFEESIDLLELAGAAHVLALKKQLGEHLAARINAGHAEAHVVGAFGNLLIADFSVHNTPFMGKPLSEISLQQATGLKVVGIWSGARFLPPDDDTVLSRHCLPVVVGTREQIQRLNELLIIYDTNWHPVLVLGGGKVGRSATRALKVKGLKVHIVEKQGWLERRIGDLPDKLFIGDAADRALLEEAGIFDAPAVLLTTNDDAMNIYLTVYCRRLNPALHIVCRVTHERNVEAMRRAGADLVLNDAELGVESILSILLRRELVLLGEGVEFQQVGLPASLVGKTLDESDIKERTGLNVLGVVSAHGLFSAADQQHELESGSELVMIGEMEQFEAFLKTYGK